MIPIITLIVSFSIAVLLGVAVYYLRKQCKISVDSWAFFHSILNEYKAISESLSDNWALQETLRGEAEETNKKLDELNKFMKTTFKAFSENTKDVIEMKGNVPSTTEIIGMDGKKHTVPIDKGW